MPNLSWSHLFLGEGLTAPTTIPPNQEHAHILTVILFPAGKSWLIMTPSPHFIHILTLPLDQQGNLWILFFSPAGEKVNRLPLKVLGRVPPQLQFSWISSFWACQMRTNVQSPLPASSEIREPTATLGFSKLQRSVGSNCHGQRHRFSVSSPGHNSHQTCIEAERVWFDHHASVLNVEPHRLAVNLQMIPTFLEFLGSVWANLGRLREWGVRIPQWAENPSWICSPRCHPTKSDLERAPAHLPCYSRGCWWSPPPDSATDYSS